MPHSPIFYLYIYRKIRKNSRARNILYSSLLEIMKRFLPFTPRVLYFPMIKELEKFGLIKKISKDRYEVIGGNADFILNQYNCP